MRRAEFERFRELIYQTAGIALSDEKAALLESRLSKRLRALGLSNEEEYLRIIELDQDPRELINLIDAISTNTTNFYREPRHFEMLSGIFEQWRETHKEIRLWCAAASSGEEPYTLAITASESLDLRRTKFRMLATDISTKALKKALSGTYTQKQVENVPKPLLYKYFVRQTENGQKYYSVCQELRSLILFKRFNLASFPYPLKGPFDAVFCRNVMIYFDTAMRQKVVDALYALLRPGGYLFIGHSENLLGLKHEFETIGSSVFQKRGARRRYVEIDKFRNEG